MIKKNPSITVILAFFGFGFMMMNVFMLLSSPTLYSNKYLITEHTTDYFKWKNDFNTVVHFFEQYNFDEEVSIRYSVKGIFVEPYNNPDYQFLTESKFILKNERFFRHYVINCYKTRVAFTASSNRNTQEKYVSLVRCPAIEEYYPNCIIYSNDNYPKDTDTNCMYHIEGDWYVRLP